MNYKNVLSLLCISIIAIGCKPAPSSNTTSNSISNREIRTVKEAVADSLDAVEKGVDKGVNGVRKGLENVNDAVYGP